MKTKLIILTLFALLFCTATNGVSQVQNASCPTDINNDGITSQADLNLLLAQFGTSCTSGQPCPTDINHDGRTSQADFNLLLGKCGQRCNVVIFDVTHAVYSTGYVDVPVSISSDNTINSLDFALKFNEGKMTFNTMIQNITDPSMSSAYYFNPGDRTLRFTSNSFNAYPNDISLFSIRFAISSGTTINTSDFNTIAAYLNGNVVGFILK